MPITAADISVLFVLARYYVLTREQIQRLCFPDHASGRSTRKRLSKLVRAGYVNKHRVPVALPGASSAAPVYFPTSKGAELLASYYDDERYYRISTRTPRADLVAHWIAISETHMIVERAVEADGQVELAGWVNEWETINKDAGTERDRFVLHTQLRQEPALSCSPDAAFLLSVRGHKKVFYLEQDRATSSPKQIAARKTKGYAELAKRRLHRKHFPQTTLETFSVLLVTPGANRTRAIAREVAKKPSPELWLFVDQHELTGETFLYDAITLNHEGERGPLVKRPAESDSGGHENYD